MTLKILTRITGRHVQCTSSLCYWPFFLQIIRGKVNELSNYIQHDILGYLRGNFGVKLQFKLPANFWGDIVLLQFLGRCFGLDTQDTFCAQRALGSKYELLILFFILFPLLCPLCSRATLLIYVFPEVHLQFFGTSMLSLDFIFSNFSCMFLNSNGFFSNLNTNCSNLLGMKNLQEHVKKAFFCRNLF